MRVKVHANHHAQPLMTLKKKNLPILNASIDHSLTLSLYLSPFSFSLSLSLTLLLTLSCTHLVQTWQLSQASPCFTFLCLIGNKVYSDCVAVCRWALNWPYHPQTGWSPGAVCRSSGRASADATRRLHNSPGPCCWRLFFMCNAWDCYPASSPQPMAGSVVMYVAVSSAGLFDVFIGDCRRGADKSARVSASSPVMHISSNYCPSFPSQRCLHLSMCPAPRGIGHNFGQTPTAGCLAEPPVPRDQQREGRGRGGGERGRPRPLSSRLAYLWTFAKRCTMLINVFTFGLPLKT